MMLPSKAFAFGAVILFDMASGQDSSNPVDTADQRLLDELATRLHQQRPYDDLISGASQLYASIATENGYDASSAEMQRTLAQAMDELAFGNMQKAVNDDPAHPKVYSILNPPRGSIPGGRYAYDNPDAIYRIIPISSLYDYEIHGKRTAAGPADVSFTLTPNVNVPSNLAVLAAQDLVVEPDGSFLITVSNSTNSSSPNHIQSVDSAVQLFIRNNIADGSTQVPDFLEVEIRSSDELPEPMAEDEIVRKARANFQESLPAFALGLWANETLSQLQNVINPPAQRDIGTLATQANSFSHYNLSETDTIVLTFGAAASTYWVVTATSLWMTTDRPGEQLESLNIEQAVPNGNGTYTIVLSSVDPRVSNWIVSPKGGAGTLMCRFQGFPPADTGNPNIELWSQVVTLDNLKSVLPNGTRWISQQERENQLKERFESYSIARDF